MNLGVCLTILIIEQSFRVLDCFFLKAEEKYGCKFQTESPNFKRFT